MGEIYSFVQGNGHVKLGEYTPGEVRHDIHTGLHVNIPARTLHGIQAGSEGCEFVWMFPGKRWKDIPYFYVDPELANRNVPVDFDEELPRPRGAADWTSLRENATRVISQR